MFVRWCVLLVAPWLASAQTSTAMGGIQGRVSESITARPTILHPGYLPAVQPEVRVVLRRISAVDLVLLRGRDEPLAEVVVSARALNADPVLAPNTVQLDREEIRRIPGSGGDIFRALDVLPGVVATGASHQRMALLRAYARCDGIVPIFVPLVQRAALARAKAQQD